MVHIQSFFLFVSAVSAAPFGPGLELGVGLGGLSAGVRFGDISLDVRCGDIAAGASCLSIGDGYGCSLDGYCGNTARHCELSQGCQSLFGFCVGGSLGSSGSSSGNGLPFGHGGSGGYSPPQDSSTSCTTTTPTIAATATSPPAEIPSSAPASVPIYTSLSTPASVPSPTIIATVTSVPTPTSIAATSVSAPSSVPSSVSSTNSSTVSRTPLGSVPYAPAAIYSCSVPGTVALTFSDGPYNYTDCLLDLLEEYNATATFFISGDTCESDKSGWESTVQAIHQRGHQLGAQSWSNSNLSALCSADIKDDMYKLEEAFMGAVGSFPTYFRPPHDSCSNSTECPDTMGDLGYHIALYDVDTEDSSASLQTAKLNFIAGIQSTDTFQSSLIAPSNSFTVVQHDISEASAKNLTQYELETLKTRGFKVVTLGECLGDEQANWYRGGQSSTESSY